MSSTPVLRGGHDFDMVARRIVLASIEYLDEMQACPFCELGHVPEEVFSMHANGCPLQGFERTDEIEKLREWAVFNAPDGEHGL